MTAGDINNLLSFDTLSSERAFTRPYHRAPEVSPPNQSFHHHGNAETYMLVGEAMGKAMVEMRKK